MKGLNKNCCRAISIFLSKYQSLLMRTSFHSLMCLIQELIATNAGSVSCHKVSTITRRPLSFFLFCLMPVLWTVGGVEAVAYWSIAIIVLLRWALSLEIHLSKVYSIEHRVMITTARCLSVPGVRVVRIVRHVKGRWMRRSVAGIALLLVRVI